MINLKVIPLTPAHASSNSARRRFTDLCVSGCLTCANGRDFSSIARSSLDYTAVGTGSFSNRATTGSTEKSAATQSNPHAPSSRSNVDMTSDDVCGNHQDDCVAGSGRSGQPGGGDASREVLSGEGRIPGDLTSRVPWKTVRGRFQSVGAAIISCRNDKAPDGMAAYAHLADGNLHLILIRECTRVQYLR